MPTRRENELNTLLGGKKKRKCCCCSSHPVVCASSLLALSIVCVAVVVCGTALHPTINQKVQDAIAEHVKLTEGSTATAQFRHSSAPFYSTFYFFNLTNAYDVANHKAKPILKQLGPYSYRENRTSFDLVWLEDDTVLQYKTNITYTLDQERSQGNDPDQDIVTTINVPLIGVFNMVEHKHSSLLDDFMKVVDLAKKEFHWGDGIFVKKSVSQLLWGYNDSTLHFIRKYLGPLDHDLKVDPLFAFSNKSTIEEPNLVYTGVGNLTQANQYIQWNGHYNMSGWGNPWAAAINGTSAYAFHPEISKTERLYGFIDELYRSGYFDFVSEVIEHGIKLYKFVLPDIELDNTTQEAGGFHAQIPSGVLNLTAVMPSNVPLFASKPHFLHADPVYRENVSGMHPVVSIHDSYLALEPITGVVMDAAKRIQLNLCLGRSNIFAELKKVRDRTMFPIYYVEQTGKITSSLASEFKNNVYAVKYGISWGIWAIVGLAGLGLAVSVMCLLCFLKEHCRNRHFKGTNRLPNYASINSDNA